MGLETAIAFAAGSALFEAGVIGSIGGVLTFQAVASAVIGAAVSPSGPYAVSPLAADDDR